MKPLHCLTLACAGLVFSACSLVQPSHPSVFLSSPASGSQFQTGQDVTVQSTSNDTAGIVRVELVVDNQVVHTDPSPTGQGQPQFTVVQTWKAANPGTHVLTVRATNSKGDTGEGAVNVTVLAEATPLAAVTATGGPAGPVKTATPVGPAPTLTQVPAGPTGTASPLNCTPDATYVADVTAPDGTSVAAGSSFIKTWRVRNAGTCAWDSGYTIAFAGGQQLGAPSPALAPNAAPGAVVDVSLSMVAPTSPGPYAGNWKMRAPNGTSFGVNLTVVINVPNAPPGPSVTPAPSATSVPSAPTATATATKTAASATEILAQITIGPGLSAAATAACPAGSKVTGGGFASNVEETVYNSSLQGNGWEAAAKNISAFPQLFNAYALCVSNIPGTVSQVFKQVTIPAGSSAQAIMPCPAGTVLTGGGFAANPNVTVYSNAGDGNGWEAAGKNNSATGQLLNAYAVCYSGPGASSTQVLKQITVAAGTTGTATVACAAGSIVTGGGFAVQTGTIGKGTSKPPNENGWQSFGTNTTAASSLMNGYAICTSF